MKTKEVVDGWVIETYDNGTKVRYPVQVKDTTIRRQKILVSDFTDLFSDTQLEDILDSNNKKVKKFVFWLQVRNEIDVENQKTIDILNGLEQLGLIGIGEADRIYNGALTLSEG